MTIKCPNCKKEIEISKEIYDHYYNWKCDCDYMIPIKGNFNFKIK